MQTLPGETWEVGSAWGRLPSLACSPWKHGMQPVHRQESGQLSEPCHCGQTPRLPENKHRRGLEAVAEAGHRDLPSRPAPDWLTGGSSSPCRQPGGPQEARGGAQHGRADPRATPSINIHSAPALGRNGVGIAGTGTGIHACSSGRGGWAREHAGNRTALGAF